MNPDRKIIFATLTPAAKNRKQFNYRLFFLFFFVSLLTFDVSHLYSQQPTQEWVRRYTDTSSAYWGGVSIKSDSIGYIYILTGGDFGFGFLKYNSAGTLISSGTFNPSGYSNSSKAFDVTPAGEVYITGTSNMNFIDYMYTVKFNTSGVIQWSSLYNPDNDDAPNDVKVDKAGNIILVGSSVIGNTNFGLVIKYNSNGDTLWTKHFNNGQNEAVMDKEVLDDSNNIYITGYVGLPGKCSILKYSSVGNLVWYTPFTIDSNRTNSGQGIALDINRNIYVIGTSSVPSSGLNDFLLKLSNGGEVLWNRIFTGIINNLQGSCEYLAGPVVSSDGNAIYFTSNCENGTGGGGYSIATLKYNSSGDSQWVKVFNGGGVVGTANVPSSIKLDRNGNVYMCGIGYYQTTGNDFATIKYSPVGLQQWIATYSGEVTNGVDYSKDIFIDTSLNVYVTGSSPNLHSGGDAVTIKYNQPIGIRNYTNTLPRSFSLSQNFPNPFNSSTEISYELPRRSFIQIKVFNILGQEIRTLVNKTQAAGTYILIADFNNIPSGIYFYRMQADGIFFETKKFILVK